MRRGGPKVAITAEPLSFKGWPRDRAKRRIRFIEKYVIVPKGHGAGKPLKLRSFQKEIITGAFADGIRMALVSIPRANAKTTLAAALGVAELFVGPMGAEVLVVASDQRQANIALSIAKRMIELNPELASRAHLYQDKIVVPHTGAMMTALPADPAALHGFDPSILITDELHVVTEDVWAAATSVAGKRPESLTLAISTPASTADCVMHRLVDLGRSGSDPSMYLKEFMAPEGCAVDDREAWRIANPALSCEQPFLAEDGLASVVKTLREPVFRQLRLGQWVSGVDAWLPFGAWGELVDADRVVADKQKVVLGFDGSASGDSTALVGCTVGADPHVFVLGAWENPGDPRWRVPRLEVAAAVAAAFDRFDVVELAADPWGWRSEIESWAELWPGRVLEWPTNVHSRMGPATDRFFQLVLTKNLAHDGDSRLARHMGNARAKSTPSGDQLRKGSYTDKIDLAVAAVVAVDRAAFHSRQGTKRKRALSW